MVASTGRRLKPPARTPPPGHCRQCKQYQQCPWESSNWGPAGRTRGEGGGGGLLLVDIGQVDLLLTQCVQPAGEVGRPQPRKRRRDHVAPPPQEGVQTVASKVRGVPPASVARVRGEHRWLDPVALCQGVLQRLVEVRVHPQRGRAIRCAPDGRLRQHVVCSRSRICGRCQAQVQAQPRPGTGFQHRGRLWQPSKQGCFFRNPGRTLKPDTCMAGTSIFFV